MTTKPFIERVAGAIDCFLVCRDINEDARAEDIREWRTASGGEAFHTSLRRAVQGPNVWAVWADGRAIAVFGVDPNGARTARGWLLLSREAVNHRLLSLHKLFLQFLSNLPYTHLECWADSRNTLHLKWLERVGFVFNENRSLSVAGVPFHFFTYTKEQQAACASP